METNARTRRYVAFALLPAENQNGTVRSLKTILGTVRASSKVDAAAMASERATAFSPKAWLQIRLWKKVGRRIRRLAEKGLLTK